MITVTRFNGEKFFVNPHLIEFIEETPDTVVTLVTGRKVVIKETVKEVLERIIAYRRRIGEGGAEIVSTEIRGDC